MKKLLTLLFLILLSNFLTAQISINDTGNPPDSSAILDIQSSERGLLIPRMTTLEMVQIASPATGLLVFNSDSVDIYVFDGTYWMNIRRDAGPIDPNGFYCPGTVEYGGQTYGVVEIAGMCWMSENLNIGTMISGSAVDNGVIEKYCYQDNAAHCNTYGGLYDWNEMMQYSTGDTVQGICPPGWHVPSEAEWCTMTTFVDPTVNCGVSGWTGTDIGYKLKSTSGWYSNWNGSDAVGFTGLPGGVRPSPGNYLDMTTYGFWWSSQPSSGNAWNRRISAYDDDMGSFHNGQSYGMSVRCVKD